MQAPRVFLPGSHSLTVSFLSYSDFSSRQGGVWSILNRFMIGAILVAICVGGALAILPVFKERQQESARIDNLRAELARKKAELVWRRRELELLKTNREYVETIARDRLGLMKPGETIVHIEAPGESDAPNPAATPTAAAPAR